ncbi:transposase [Pedobacter sp. GSP4]|uniref:transposase n=1 Tax=Pedobacter sp. GSP4 TaxID=3453716 RepID=UPI003EE88DA1
MEKRIEACWSTDERLAGLMTLIQSVVGIGPVTALEIIIATNEFININNPRAFASYSGVAPFNYQSGTSVKKRARISGIANKKIKSLLHLSAMSAVRHIPDIREYWKRKTTVEGKNKMSVLNAVRFKMICRIFACVRDNRPYESEYQPKPPLSVQQPDGSL